MKLPGFKFVVSGPMTDQDERILRRAGFTGEPRPASARPGYVTVTVVIPFDKRFVCQEDHPSDGRSSYFLDHGVYRHCVPGEIAAAAKAGRKPRLSAGFGPWGLRKDEIGLRVGCQRVKPDQLVAALRCSDRMVRTAKSRRRAMRVLLGTRYVTVRRDGSVLAFGVLMSRGEVNAVGRSMVAEYAGRRTDGLRGGSSASARGTFEA